MERDAEQADQREWRTDRSLRGGAQSPYTYIVQATMQVRPLIKQNK